MSQVGDLRARLTADVSDFVRNFKSAGQVSTQTTREIRVNVDQLKVAAALGPAFGAVGAGLGDMAVAMRGMADAAKSLPTPLIPVTPEQERAVAGISGALRSVGQNLGPPTAGFGRLGTQVTSTVAGLLRISGVLPPVAATALILGERATRVASGLSSWAAANTNLVTTLATVGGAVAAAAAGYAIFRQALAAGEAATERAEARVKAFTDSLQESAETTRGIIIDIRTENALAKLNELDAAVERFRLTEIQPKIEAGTISRGLATTRLEEFRTEAVESIFRPIAEQSQAAGDELQKNIREGATAALAEFDKLKAGLEAGLPTASLERFKALASELSFRGPVTELASLDTALRQNEEAIRKRGEAAGLVEEEIQRQVDETTAIMKRQFQETIAGAEAMVAAVANAGRKAHVAATRSGAAGGGTGSPFDVAVNLGIGRGLNPIAAEIEARSLFAFGDITPPPVVYPVQAKGSPRLPFTDYFRSYAPGVIRDFAASAENTPLNFGTNIDELRTELATLRGAVSGPLDRPVLGQVGGAATSQLRSFDISPSTLTLESQEMFREIQERERELIAAIASLERRMADFVRLGERTAQATEETASASTETARSLSKGGLISTVERDMRLRSGNRGASLT